jgi:peptidyl-dipeptidase Dcp
VRVWAVDDADGTCRGLLYLDPYARPGKRGGAWMDSYADPAPLLGRLPLVVLHLNVTRPAPHEPALLTPLEVRILFHEFGHALHMLLSDVEYPRVAGINVASDVVEFPSKFHESLAMRPDVLSGYARHYETGAPLAEADVAALTATARDNAAYWTTQGVANALLDQAWHGLAPGDTVDPDAVDAFEADVLARHGLDLRATGLHYRSSFFVHIFDGLYAGTHYSYLWSAALEAAALGWLDEQGGLSRLTGGRLRDELLSQGAVVDPLAAVRAITGRDPSVQPLLERRGLT